MANRSPPGPHMKGSQRLSMALAPIAASPALPPEILDRPKTGFSIPVQDWIGGGAGAERGLRGWAKRVYGEFCGQ